MTILALEFSASDRSVAVAREENGTAILAMIRETDFRGVTGLSLVDRALGCAKVNASEISRIAVGLGPGSYTGIRSAIALAQGWQLGRNVELVGMSSIAVLAEQARALEWYGQVTIVVDAQRRELYVARYRVEAAGCSEKEALRICALSEIDGNEAVIGPEASKFFPGARDVAPGAEMLAKLALGAKCVPGERLEPIYLRETSFVKAPMPRIIK